MRRPLVLAGLVCVASVLVYGDYVTVSPANMNGWSPFADVYPTSETNTSSTSFVNGPGTPPLGNGSFQANIGSNGDSYAGIGTDNYDGIALSNLTGLGYSSYQQQNNGEQATYLVVGVNYSDHSTSNADDYLFFEPVYQNGQYQSVDGNGNVQSGGYPNQCGSNSNCVVTGQWQSWNALEGGFWSDYGTAGPTGAGGPPVITLASYDQMHPGSIISGGIYLQSGGGAGPWDNFIGNVDAFYINTNTGPNDTVDFEPGTATPEPATWGLMAIAAGLGLGVRRLRRRS